MRNKADKSSGVSYPRLSFLDIEEVLNRGSYLIKAVETSLAGLLLYDSRLLEKKIGDNAADWVVLEVKFDVHVLAEATRVVIAVGLGVAEALQDRIALNQNVLDAEI